MKTLLIGILLLIVSFVLKVAFVVVLLKICGVEFGGFIGKVFHFFGLSINGFSLPK